MTTDEPQRFAEQGEPRDPLTDAQMQRLLAHLMAPETRRSRLSDWLLDFGRRGVAEDRDSRNPVKWLAAEIATWMADARTKRINRRFDRQEADRG